MLSKCVSIKSTLLQYVEYYSTTVNYTRPSVSKFYTPSLSCVDLFPPRGALVVYSEWC